MKTTKYQSLRLLSISEDVGMQYAKAEQLQLKMRKVGSGFTYSWETPEGTQVLSGWVSGGRRESIGAALSELGKVVVL